LVVGFAIYWFLKPSEKNFQKTIRFERISPEMITHDLGIFSVGLQVYGQNFFKTDT
jgi:multicomponent Na+:H+ antiporter subunit A